MLLESADCMVQGFDRYVWDIIHTQSLGNFFNLTPIQGPLLKNDKNFHHKRDSFHVIPHILSEKVINNITIKASYDIRIIDPNILNICSEGNFEPLYVCNKSMIKF